MWILDEALGHYRLIALSFTVIFLYGGMIWYIFPVKAKMSWEGHLAGFVTGLIFAFLFKIMPIRDKFSWEEEDYDKNVKELVIPATSMNIEDAKLLINSKVERQRVFDLGKKYAKLFLTYQPSKEQTE